MNNETHKTMDIRELDWFYAEVIPQKGILKLSADETRHLKVKRHYENEKIAVFDGKGTVAVAKLVGKDEIQIELVQKFQNEAFLTIATAVPKGERFDFLLQKLTELNVATIVPIKTKYSVVLPKEAKIERSNRILIEACKQSKRAWVPEIIQLTDFSSVLKEKVDVKLILYQNGEKLKEIPKNKKVLVLVGPEGGFTEEEIKAAEKAGFVKASVGRNVLRIETAAIAAAAIIGQQ